jgi:hypothetical protein
MIEHIFPCRKQKRQGYYRSPDMVECAKAPAGFYVAEGDSVSMCDNTFSFTNFLLLQ